jgi:hypothetical protein
MPVTGNNTKIPVTGNNAKYQLQGTIPNASYSEQYKSTTNRNNTNISVTQYKLPVTGKYTKYQLQGTM